MKIGIVTEVRSGEQRVALVPESARRLANKGVGFVVQSGAGLGAGFTDADYEAVGATIVASREAVLADADTLVQVNVPDVESIGALRKGAATISLLFPLVQHDVVRALRDASVTGISLDRIPRTTLAQSMDVLSSQATIAGYRAVITAASHLPKLFPLFMTAAGRIEPARVVILGAGVAGLVAIGIARRLGAVVEAYDVRAVVKEQVESLGATFIDVGVAADAATSGGYAKEVSEDFQRRANEVIATHLEKADVCITTALIPGRPAPRLVTAEMARRMRPGSVIVDLAVAQGGNCPLSKPDQVVDVGGVKIMGFSNLPARLPADASSLYARNLFALLPLLTDKESKAFAPAWDDEIIQGAMLTRGGALVHPHFAPKSAA
jgi:NAD(P) transhydrogenase subunit alpha